MSPIFPTQFFSNTLRNCQRRFEERHPSCQFDDRGREILITQQDIDEAIDAMAGSEQEFICYLARHSAA